MKPSLHKAKIEGGTARTPQRADSSPVMRGVFVHRRGEIQKDERLVAEFWRRCGLGVEALEKPGERFSTMPDLLLSRSGVPWAYCEVKTIWQHRWTVRILQDDRVQEERTEVNDKPVEERVESDLVTALRQLHAGNPDHSLLNIVFLINRDPEASLDVIKNVLAMKPSAETGSLKARIAARLAEEIRQFQREVDLCVWTNGLSSGQPVIEGYFLFNPQVQGLVKEVAGLGSEKLVSFEPAA